MHQFGVENSGYKSRCFRKVCGAYMIKALYKLNDESCIHDNTNDLGFILVVYGLLSGWFEMEDEAGRWKMEDGIWKIRSEMKNEWEIDGESNCMIMNFLQ